MDTRAARGADDRPAPPQIKCPLTTTTTREQAGTKRHATQWPCGDPHKRLRETAPAVATAQPATFKSRPPLAAPQGPPDAPVGGVGSGRVERRA